MEKEQRVYDPETGKTFKLTILLDHLVGEDGRVTKMEEEKDARSKTRHKSFY